MNNIEAGNKISILENTLDGKFNNPKKLLNTIAMNATPHIFSTNPNTANGVDISIVFKVSIMNNII